MTVPNTNYKKIHNGNDSATSFAYDFKIFDSGHLEVIHRTSAGVESTLVEDSDYTVSGVGAAAGGSVSYPVTGSPLPTGESLTLKRVMPLTQLTNLVYGGAYLPSVIENALDKISMGILQLKESLDRSIRFKVSTDRTGKSNELPDPVTGYVIGWDSDGNFVNLEGQTFSTTDVPFPSNATALSAIDDTVISMAYMQGKTASGDKWYGMFKLYSSSTETVDGQDVIATNSGTGRWHRQNQGQNTLFTAVAGGTADAITVTTAPLADVTNDPTRLFIVENTAGPSTTTTPTITINANSTLTLKSSTSGALTVGATGAVGSKLMIAVNNAGTNAVLLNPYIPGPLSVNAAALQSQAVSARALGYVPLSCVSGLNVSNYSGDSSHDLRIDQGEIGDDTKGYLLQHNTHSIIIKQADVAFAVSTNSSTTGGFSNQDSLDTNTWFGLWMLGKSTDPTDTDFIIARSRALAITDTVAVAAGFDLIRLVTCVKTNGSSNIKNWEDAGNYSYVWDTPETTSISGTASWTQLTVDAPPFHIANLRLTMEDFDADVDTFARIIQTDMDQNTPSATYHDIFIKGETNGYKAGTAHKSLRVDSSSQVEHREYSDSYATMNLYLATQSWTMDFQITDLV